MTLSRRVAAIEASLSPTQLVLRWLAEAHNCGDMESYVASLLAQDPPVAPLDRLAREAAHGARTALRGKRPELVEATVRSALRETLFRYELVLRIYVMAHELLDREALIDAALSAHVALLTTEGRVERRRDRRTPSASLPIVISSPSGSASCKPRRKLALSSRAATSMATPPSSPT